MNSRPLPIPDLRFEQSLLKSLQVYANAGAQAKAQHWKTKKPAETAKVVAPVAAPGAVEPAPLAPITPGIVIYAIIKDVMFRPLIEGFLWATVVILASPSLRFITAQGYKCGLWFGRLIGLKR